MPSLNVMPYINECLDSVVNQTLKDIEIICIDAGSTDGTLEEIRKYADLDKRVNVIISEKRSYGFQLNIGIKEAKGKYIGIVETDDYISLDMYEKLYKIAQREKVQFIKAGYASFIDKKEEREFIEVPITRNEEYYDCVLNPQQKPELLRMIPGIANCTGIYSKNFLTKNNVMCNETPGASYQDCGFFFQVNCLANRVYYIRDSFYKIRRDREDSSTLIKGNAFVICEEYKFIYDFLNRLGKRKEKFMPVYWFRKYLSYLFTLDRISMDYKLDFLKRFSEEFKEARDSGELRLDLFNFPQKKFINDIVDDYAKYFKENIEVVNSVVIKIPLTEEEERTKLIQGFKTRKIKVKELEKEIKKIKNTWEYKTGYWASILPQSIFKGARFFKRIIRGSKK